MMNWLVKWGVKRYALSIVNSALAQYNESVNTARAVVQKYIGKAEALLAFLKSVDAKLIDSKLTNEEADEICEEAVALGEQLVR